MATVIRILLPTIAFNTQRHWEAWKKNIYPMIRTLSIEPRLHQKGTAPALLFPRLLRVAVIQKPVSEALKLAEALMVHSEQETIMQTLAGWISTVMAFPT